MQRSTDVRRVAFPSAGSQAVQLEGVLHSLEGEKLPAAVVCHPHPLGGGSMHNSLVVAMARALAAQGIMALRFNFRGVGGSGGEHDHGPGEQADLAGALDWLLAQPGVDPLRVSLAGYSFGAWVALAHAQTDPRVGAVAMVGLPAEYCDADEMGTFTRPKYFVTGEHDQLAPCGALHELVEQLPAPKTIRVVLGTDHFFAGLEQKVGLLIADFLSGRGALPT